MAQNTANNNAPIRVLLSSISLDTLGGQSIQAIRLLENFSDDSRFAFTFVPHNPQLPAPLDLLQKVFILRTIFTTLAYVLILFREVNRHDVAHVFSASYYAFLLAPAPALLVAKLFGKPVVLHYHSGQLEDHLKRSKAAVSLMRRFNRIVVPSGFLRDVFAKFDLEAQVISNLIDTDCYRFHKRSPLRPVFLTNRNFEPHYNVGCVLRAFALIQKRHSDAKLIVAGNGTEKEKLMRLAHDLNLTNVEFVGGVKQTDMPRYYNECDIYLNGSSIDNLPNSIVEAYASGLPVASTNAGGIPYILRDGETGFLVDKNDHAALAGAALKFLQNNETAQKIIESARLEVNKYTWHSIGKEWIKLYTQLAAS
jgi:glycosyltransferase involved in cell wall biosynthesis